MPNILADKNIGAKIEFVKQRIAILKCTEKISQLTLAYINLKWQKLFDKIYIV